MMIVIRASKAFHLEYLDSSTYEFKKRQLSKEGIDFKEKVLLRSDMWNPEENQLKIDTDTAISSSMKVQEETHQAMM